MSNSFQGSAGVDPYIAWQVSPTGGIVVLNLDSAAPPSTWALTRYVVGVSGLVNPTALVSGSTDQIPIFFDLGDGTNVPLDPQTLYEYEFATATGSVSTRTISVSGAIVLESDNLTRVMMRSMQAGLASLVLPSQFTQRPSISYSMPMTTQIRYPMVLLNLDLLQQQEIPIGQGLANNSAENIYNVPSIALRRYVVRVYTTNVDERDFYRDAIIAIFNSILGPLLQQIGVNTSHRYQASNGQMTGGAMQPGVFYAEIALQFSGLYNVAVSTYFPLIEHITFAVSGVPGIV